MDHIFKDRDAGPDPFKVYDLVIVGGGVNGTGIARDAALRGLSVCLLEQGDLASGTSSYSTKLIHGGLRYLEYGAFGLVSEALRERALLLEVLAGFVRPLRLILPHQATMRPQWLLRIGVWLYDHLAPRGTLEASRKISLKTDELGAPLAFRDRQGFEFSDCVVDDARLVVFNALEAEAVGAKICPNRQVSQALRVDGMWHVTCHDGTLVKAKTLINATGPFVNHFIETVMQGFVPCGLRLVRGSHIIVPRLFEHDRAYMLQQPDKRIIFAIPYEEHFTLVGTTEVAHEGEISDVRPSEDELNYLIDAVNQSFKRKIEHSDIVHFFAGIRPLVDEPEVSASGVSREYKLIVETAGGAPVVHVYGGKLTTFRSLSQAVVDKLSPFFSRLESSKTETLGYAAFERPGFDEWQNEFHKRLKFLPQSLLNRYVHAYGRRADWFLQDVRSVDDLGEDFGGGLYLVEVRYLISYEWARRAEDILWRRTKCGLQMTGAQQQHFTEWFRQEAVKDWVI